MNQGFAVAERHQVWHTVRGLLARHRRGVASATLLFWLAAGFGLTGPWLLGRIVDTLARGASDSPGTATAGSNAAAVSWLASAMLGGLLLQTLCTFFANRMALQFGERVFATLREDFIHAVTRLPLSDVEAAGTGDLVNRTTHDIDNVADAVRFGIPQVSVAIVTISATFVACLLTSPLLTLAVLAGIPILIVASRWYLHRSRTAYQALDQSYSRLFGVATANVEAARMIEALQLGHDRQRACDAAIADTFAKTMRTLFLRTVLFPATNFAFSVPVMVTLLWGGWLATRGLASAGAVATVTLYVVLLAGPAETLINWIDRSQASSVALARLVGIGYAGMDRTPSSAVPAGSLIELRDVTFAYRPGDNVLHGVSLTLTPGERLAVVGPSGSGKSTLARMITGINAPDSGTATIGGVGLAARPIEELRRDVALVTQEHHVFRGSLADNVRLGRPDSSTDEVSAALDTVGADWVSSLADGLDTAIGSGSLQLTPAQAQHVALARLILLDPQTLVLDEATAMIDPTAARALERSIAAALHGRTVVAIAHRLHTARDADRIAVVIDGRLVEVGSHDALLASNGEYARLWHAWQDS